MMPISVRDNSWAIKMGYDRANDTVNRFNQGLNDASKGFEAGVIKSRLFSGEWDQKHNEELQGLWNKISDGTATDDEVIKYNELNDNRSLWQKAKDFMSSPKSSTMPNSIYDVPELDLDDETVPSGEIVRNAGRSGSDIDTSKVTQYDEHGNPLQGTGAYEDVDVHRWDDLPNVRFNLVNPYALGDTQALDSMPQPTKGELARALAKSPNLRDVNLPLRAAETAGIATGYLPYSEQDKIKDNQRFLDEQAYQEAVRKAEASSIDNLRKQGEFNANENVLAEAISKQGDLTPNEKIATVNSIAKIKGIAPVEAAAENMSPEQVNNLVNTVRAKTEGPLAAEARRALQNIESQGFTVGNVLELAKINALSNLNLPYDKANSTDVQAAIQTSIMQNADGNLIKQNSRQLIGDARMNAREFVNSNSVPPVHRSGEFATQQPTQQTTQVTREQMDSFLNSMSPEERQEWFTQMGLI